MRPPSPRTPQGGVLRGYPARAELSFDGQVPPGAASAEVYSFSLDLLSALGIDLGFDDMSAELMCETYFFGLVGDADDYRRGKLAFTEGLTFAGIPQDKVKGPPLEVAAFGDCWPSGFSFPLIRTYGGLTDSQLTTDTTIANVVGDSGGSTSIIYIQNAGSTCAEVILKFDDDSECRIVVAPGETVQFDVANCTGPGYAGGVEIASSEPVAVFKETFKLAPDIEVSPLLLDFGNVPVGSFKTMTLLLSNRGPGDLIIGAISTLAAPFSIRSDQCSGQTLGPAGNCTIEVDFSPLGQGNERFDGQLTIASNDPDENPVLVGLIAQSLPSAPVPALSPWGVGMMTLFMAGLGVWMIRRKRITV